MKKLCNFPSHLNSISIGHSLACGLIYPWPQEFLALLQWSLADVCVTLHFSLQLLTHNQASSFDIVLVLHIIFKGFNGIQPRINILNVNISFCCSCPSTFLSLFPEITSKQLDYFLISTSYYLLNSRPPNDINERRTFRNTSHNYKHHVAGHICCHLKENLKWHIFNSVDTITNI